MHMADAMISPAVGATMYVASGLVAAYSIRKIRKEEDFKKKIPTMGVMGAFVFATQMVNFTIPGTGSSGHLCGGLLLSSILGPFAGFLSMIGVLLIQCLFFADGGLLALGANVWNMAFYGCFVGSLIWKLVMKKRNDKGKNYTCFSIRLCINLAVRCIFSNIRNISFRNYRIAIWNFCSDYATNSFGNWINRRIYYSNCSLLCL